MKSRIDNILNELGFDTPDMEPINKREALERGMIKGTEAPKKGPCGKSVFSSEIHCDQAIKKRLKAGFGGTSFLRSYYCNTCCGYHMSSQNNRTKL